MELIGTADGGVVLEKVNEDPKPEGKPHPRSSLLSNLDSSAFEEGTLRPLNKLERYLRQGAARREAQARQRAASREVRTLLKRFDLPGRAALPQKWI